MAYAWYFCYMYFPDFVEIGADELLLVAFCVSWFGILIHYIYFSIYVNQERKTIAGSTRMTLRIPINADTKMIRRIPIPANRRRIGDILKARTESVILMPKIAVAPTPIPYPITPTMRACSIII